MQCESFSCDHLKKSLTQKHFNIEVGSAQGGWEILARSPRLTRDKNNQIELSFTAFYPAEEKRKQVTSIAPHKDTFQLYLLCVKHAWGVRNLKVTTLFTTLYLWISVHWMNLFRLLSVQSIRLLLLTTSDFYRFPCIFTGNTLASIQ